MARDWEEERRDADERLRGVEDRLAGSLADILAESLGGTYGRIVRGDTIDPRELYAGARTWEREIGAWVDGPLREVVDDARGDSAELVPEATTLIAEHLAAAKNRLANVPDTVYERIKRLTLTATSDGWSNERLADQIHDVLVGEGADAWEGRAMVIARTEAISAHNAGTYASFLAMARIDPGDWEKAWLATEDGHTRPSHRRADGQRRPLKKAFSVGKARLMYPGDPTGPPGEVIQCRCTLLMLEPGEDVDMTNRAYSDPDDWEG